MSTKEQANTTSTVNRVESEGPGMLKTIERRYGSRVFYDLLQKASLLHSKKSHDYASNDSPYANYKFGGKLALLFKHSELDAGFVSRIGEKIYRLSNLESDGKIPMNEPVEDTELDLVVIMVLWMAARQESRNKMRQANEVAQRINRTNNGYTNCTVCGLEQFIPLDVESWMNCGRCSSRFYVVTNAHQHSTGYGTNNKG